MANLPTPTPSVSNVLTLAPNGDEHYQQAPRLAKKAYPIPLKWKYIVALHLSGRSNKEIAAITGYADMSISRILKDERCEQLRQSLLEDTQKEFDALWSTVVDNLRAQLTCSDTSVQQAAQAQWLKASGKFAPKMQAPTTMITAEDVVVNILNQNGDFQR